MFDPDKNPKGFLTILVAGGIVVFNPEKFDVQEAYAKAEEFIAETEKRYGSLNPGGK